MLKDDEVATWTRDCLETLRLADLYGKNGTRFEDPEAARIQGEEIQLGQPAPPGKPIKRFLKYLKELDARWLEDNPGDAPSRTGKRKEKRSEDYTTATLRLS